MVDQREGYHSHEFIMSEANGTRSRLVGVVTAAVGGLEAGTCLLYTSPSPRDQRGSRMPSSA